MAININQLNAQFDAFVTFARDHKNDPSYIARIEKREPGAGLIDLDGQVRTITAKSWDGRAQFWRTSGSRKVNNDVRTLFLNTILGVCGVDRIDKLPPSVQAVLKAEDFDGKGHPLTARRIKAVTDAVRIASGLTEAAGNIASGFSPAVKRIQDLVMTAPCVPANADPVKKVAAFTDKLSENTAKQITNSIPYLIGQQFIANGQMNFDAENAQFIKDRNRDMKVFIEKPVKPKDDNRINLLEDNKHVGQNGAKEVSRNYRDACDDFVQFITGGEVESYEDASESLKKQVQILMLITNQCTAQAITDAFNETISRPNADVSCGLVGGEGKAGTSLDFSLSKSANGDIMISFAQSIGTDMVVVNDEKGTKQYWMNKDLSSCHVSVELKVPAADLQRLADGDWTQINYGVYNSQQVTADEMFALIPEELRLNAKATTTVHFDIYEGMDPFEKAQEEMKKAQAQGV